MEIIVEARLLAGLTVAGLASGAEEQLAELITSKVVGDPSMHWAVGSPLQLAGFAHVETYIDQIILRTPSTPKKHVRLLLPLDPLIVQTCRIAASAHVSVILYDVHELDPQTFVSAGEESSTVIGTVYDLPHRRFDECFASLVFDSNIKNDLTDFMQALVGLGDRKVNTSIVNVNRLLLLYGPPGTGKTTLCKALAQQCSIHMCKRYRQRFLVEVNSHALHSKWFSESAKNVQALFEEITALASLERSFVFILMDEVESLTMARETSLSKNEPTDGVRAVNALLTQIDRLSERTNVMILATSNLATAVDPAFTDRADICRLIPLPTPRAIHTILVQMMDEMQRIDVIDRTHVVSRDYENDENEHDEMLSACARECYGLSGRALRKLPIKAMAKARFSIYEPGAAKMGLCPFIRLMRAVVEEEGLAKGSAMTPKRRKVLTESNGDNSQNVKT